MIFLVVTSDLTPNTAVASFALNQPGKIARDTKAFFSRTGSLWKDLLISIFKRRSSGKLSLSKTSTIVEFLSSSVSSSTETFSSLMMLHIKRMERGTFPHSFVIQIQSRSETPGNRDLIRFVEETSSNALVFTKLMGSECPKKSSDARVVRRSLICPHCVRISSINRSTCCFCLACSDSSKSSALSKITTKRSCTCCKQ